MVSGARFASLVRMPMRFAEINMKFAASQPMEFRRSAEENVRAENQETRHRSREAIRVLLCGTSSERIHELAHFLEAFEYQTITARTPQRALEAARHHRAHIAIWLETDVTTRRGAYIDAAKDLRDIAPAVESIIIGSPESSEYAALAYRAGVYNCMSWPVDYSNLARDLDFLTMEAQRRREQWLWSSNEKEVSWEGMIGGSPLMAAIHQNLNQLAQNNDPVLVTGPVGSGKELAVCALHALMEKVQPGRSYHPLMIFRCAGLTEEKAEELFAPQGILAPAPCGAAARTPASAACDTSRNALELLGFAHPEVVLIDEISDLPLPAQQKLAAWLLVNKALQRSYPVRIVASSRCDLEALAAQGRFHSGLLRLLQQQTVEVPPLTERLEDIPMLVENFLDWYAKEHSEEPQQAEAPALSRDAQRALLRHHWPGNVRELKNAVRRAAMLAKNQVIAAEDLGLTAPAKATPEADDWRGADGIKRPVWLN